MAKFYEKVRELAARLIRATETSRLQWVETDRRFAFLANIDEQNVLVATKDDDGRAPYELHILTKDGSVLEVFSTEEYGPAAATAIADLYFFARRNAKGIDKVIDDLLSKLPDEDNPF